MKKLFIAAFLFLGSCKSTDSINRFAKTAEAGLSELGRNSFGFSRFCNQYDPARLGLLTDTSVYASSPSPRVVCDAYRTSDSLLQIINRSLLGYFSMLRAVSDKKLIAYNARPLVSSLADVAPRVSPALSFSDERITAVKGLLNSVLNEPLSRYRVRRLRRIIRDNDSALSIVIQAYVFILDSALLGELDQAAENYRSFVYLPLYGQSVTPVEKALLNARYKEFMDGLSAERLGIRQSVRMLEATGKGHRLLIREGTKAGFPTVESEIAQDIVLINNLIAEIMRLTH